MDQLTELRPPDFTDVTKWWIFSNKSLLVCLGGGVIAYKLYLAVLLTAASISGCG